MEKETAHQKKKNDPKEKETPIQKNIRFIRNHNDLSQECFGKLFGATRDNIASYERGSQPRLDFINKVAAHFNLTLDTLVNGDLKKVAAPEEVRYRLPSADPLVAAERQAPYRADEEAARQTIAVYALDKSTPLSTLFAGSGSFRPIDRLSGALLPPCDGGVRLGSGEGMVPEYRSGDIVFYRQFDRSNAFFRGEACLLSFELGGNEYTMIRRIHASDRPGFLRLTSVDSRQDSREIALSEIRALARIVGSVRLGAQ